MTEGKQFYKPPTVPADEMDAPESLLSNVSPSTADFLSYMMLVMVAIFLISGPVITYIYYRKSRRMKAAQPAPSP